MHVSYKNVNVNQNETLFYEILMTLFYLFSIYSNLDYLLNLGLLSLRLVILCDVLLG
jgi:hypothetical protein